MATGNYIVNGALLQLGIIRVGQTPAPAESQDGLTVLNRLLDSMSTQREFLPVVGAQFYPMAAEKGSYTVGTSGGADLAQPRPVRIDSANFVQKQYNGQGTTLSSSLRIIYESEYRGIQDQTATADVPEVLYYAPSVPLGTFYLWPIPNVVTPCQLEANTWTPLASFPDLVTDVPLYNGLDRALVFKLAVELAPDMVGAKLTQETIASALEASAFIAKLNTLMVPGLPDIATPPATEASFEPVPSTLKATAQAKFGGTPAQ
jgi:hypothetical protein